MKTCGRCSAPIDDYVWWCWWCEAPLCSKCGDEVGHCGHPEADEVNDKSAASDPADRHQIAVTLMDRLRKRLQ